MTQQLAQESAATDSGIKSGSNLERVLAAGEFAVTGEIGPPKNFDAEKVRNKISLLKGYVDAAKDSSPSSR
jgi:methylenetetrahydrofolate reductase (NADPH)